MNSQRPNFVVVMTDTQGANMVGCYGRAGMRTPAIDQLASEGVRFNRAYTTSPICSPARAGIFTGMYSSSCGVVTNNLGLGDNVRTMGQRFRKIGYDTAYVGKWHLDGHDYFGTGSCPDGWDPEFWFDGLNYLEELTPREKELWKGGLRNIEDLRKHEIAPDFTWAHRNVDRAISFLKRDRGDAPFLLVASFDEPHGPYTCPAEFVDPFLEFDYDVGPNAYDNLKNKPIHHREWAGSFQRERTRYQRSPMFFGCNHFVDSEIGRLVDAVKEKAPENTIIIYTSDHGDMLGGHGIYSKGPVMYEEIIRVPLIIRLPESDGGEVCNAPVSHADLLPTMLAWAGESIPPILHGRDISSAAAGGALDSDRGVLVEFHRHSLPHDGWGGFIPIRCLVKRDWKLVINLHQSDELYNLKEDPHELDNRIDDESTAKLRNALHDELLAEMDRIIDPYRGPCWERREWREECSMKWMGPYRPRPSDGFSPPSRIFKTGDPAFEGNE